MWESYLDCSLIVIMTIITVGFWVEQFKKETEYLPLWCAIIVLAVIGLCCMLVRVLPLIWGAYRWSSSERTST